MPSEEDSQGGASGPRDGGGGDAAGQGAQSGKPGGRDWSSLHLWQFQPIRDVLVLLGLFGVFYLGYVLSMVTVPLLLALLLAYLFEPVIRKVTTKWGVSRRVASLSIIGVAVFMLVVPVTVGSAFAVAQGVGYARNLAGNIGLVLASADDPDDESLRDALPTDAWRWMRDTLIELRQEHEEFLDALDPEEEEDPEKREEAVEAEKEEDEERALPEELVAEPHWSDRAHLAEVIDWVMVWVRNNAEAIGTQALKTGAGALEMAFSGLRTGLMLLFGAFLTAVFFFFASTRYQRVEDFVKGLIPDKRKDRVLDLLSQMDRVIAGFVRGRLIIMLILMTMATTGYWLIGVPVPLIIGPIIGLLSIVPYVSIVGLPVTIVMLWLDPAGPEWQSSWWWVLGAPTLVYVTIQMSEDYIWNPLIQGKTTNMDVPTILFAVLAGGILAGLYGVLVAIPVAACVKILLREVFWPRFRGWTEGRESDFLPISRE